MSQQAKLILTTGFHANHLELVSEANKALEEILQNNFNITLSLGGLVPSYLYMPSWGEVPRQFPHVQELALNGASAIPDRLATAFPNLYRLDARMLNHAAAQPALPRFDVLCEQSGRVLWPKLTSVRGNADLLTSLA
ncbi:hypothetical protein OBBRIDRAFT_31560 [Obba rivulosa]|uniref:Uncharacterized protein n=1 Tax=Obba rivulosa TaxID=1052685 RepID=A0A8E2ARH1_9APHY|nr:hypothetical protein OBBRIDRAFT_31560 [Obba rivulosa]